MDKYKQTQIVYDIKGEEKNPRTYEKKENPHDGYVCIYEYGEHLLYSKYERM